ncbi:hypothetical protein TREMEDRAFT_29248, partial [Tremella mesenterica DSM 1558]|uniref:uncharacterized protein n=1 Tax=Tremella mesenterica (strain ATCC 24925 / CBS 8224 / DSM 1558 / NBRC 9311 / NRRL Y-6157 / RJB 2259-6 / UBC 559-6) TaxID=578456 RepID=UPI0003F49BB3
SVLGNTIIFPLDLITTRLQHSSYRTRKAGVLRLLFCLYRRHGLLALYRGLPADTLSTLLSSFIYFFTYSALHKTSLLRPQVYIPPVISSPAGIGGLDTKAGKVLTHPATTFDPVREVLIGVIAGVISKGLTLPISAICVRQQLGEKEEEHENDKDNDKKERSSRDSKSKSTSIWATINSLRAEGLPILFSGFAPTIPLALLPSLTLYINTLLLRLIVPSRHRAHPKGIVTFLLAALSNAIATFPLYPLVLLKALSQSGTTRQQERSSKGVMDRAGEMQLTLGHIVRTEGMQGLYKGLEGQLLKGFVQQGVMMLVKQRSVSIRLSGKSAHASA